MKTVKLTSRKTQLVIASDSEAISNSELENGLLRLFLPRNYGLKLSLAIALLGFLLTASHCAKETTVSEADKVKAVLKSATWKVQTVTVDAVDQSTLFKNFTLTFSDDGFTASNGGVVWPATGTWSFTDANATAFTRNDGITVSITTVSDTKLVLAFTWLKTTLGPGRVESVQGATIFTLIK